jgi:DNA (cytosine-5)-methyltransferase 1
MTHGSLFSGIGGFDLAAEWMGWDNKFHCEWNEFGQKILHHYWPEAEMFTDITKSNFTKYANKIDVLSGGFPCQPYSSAGKRLGKEDDRHLWPQMLRTIREVQPRWVVGENVRGLTNWNGGLVFDEVQSDLEASGYQVTPFLLPACAVGAVHRRDRIWFVAYSKGGDRRGEYGVMGGKEESKASGGEADANTKPTPVSSAGNVTNPGGGGLEANYISREPKESLITTGSNGQDIPPTTSHNATNTTGFGQEHEMEDKELGRERPRQSYKRGTWDSFPSVSPICVGNDGLPSRLDGITFPKWRNESVKAAGNAIVPHVAYQIFMTIQEYERVHKDTNVKI